MPAQTTLSLSSLRPAAVIVAQGKLLDYIDGTSQRVETPEEYVRQEIAKSLVREYGYAKRDIEVEFQLRVGTKKPRADLVVFPENVEHTQETASLLIECKHAKTKPSDKDDGVGQLKSYLYVCPNAEYGMWTNGTERFCYRRVVRKGKIEIDDDIVDIQALDRHPKMLSVRPLSNSSQQVLTPCSFAFAAATITSMSLPARKNRMRFGISSS